MKFMSRYSHHAWVDEMSIHLHCYVTQGISTNSKAIAGYSPTVTHLDTKLAFLKIASWKQLCVVHDDQYSIQLCSSHFICA